MHTCNHDETRLCSYCLIVESPIASHLNAEFLQIWKLTSDTKKVQAIQNIPVGLRQECSGRHI